MLGRICKNEMNFVEKSQTHTFPMSYKVFVKKH